MAAPPPQPLQPAPYFRALRKFLGPPWLTQNGESELVGYALDLLKDGFVERLRQGLLARMPQNDPTGQTTAPDDALAAMGRDRGIRRGLNEPAQSYALRLTRWLQYRKTQGNPLALMQQLSDYLGAGPAFATVDVRGNWYSRAADGTVSISLGQANWDWDSAPDALARWARFWVVIYVNGYWEVGPNWGDPGSTWGEAGRTWGSTATSDEIQSLRSIISDWKPAGTRCVNIILAFDSSAFQPTTARDGTGLPDGTWGHWSKVSGGAYVPSRLSTARFVTGT